MSETNRVVVNGHAEIRELTFTVEPRVGDVVRVPDFGGDLRCYVHEVVHSARLPNRKEVVRTCLVIAPESLKNTDRT